MEGSDASQKEELPSKQEVASDEVGKRHGVAVETSDIYYWVKDSLKAEIFEIRSRHESLLEELSLRLNRHMDAVTFETEKHPAVGEVLLHTQLGNGASNGVELQVSEVEINGNEVTLEHTGSVEVVEVDATLLAGAEASPKEIWKADVLLEKEEEAPKADHSPPTKRPSLQRSGSFTTPKQASKSSILFQDAPSSDLRVFWWDPRRLALSPRTEVFFGSAIIINTLLMALELQYNGMIIGHSIKPELVAHGEDMWPGAAVAFLVSEWIFGIVFTLELILKITGLRSDFCKEPWNIFDSIIVLAWIIDKSSGALPVDPLMLRAARIARCLRLLRLVRTIQAFDALYVMTTAIRYSVTTLCWVFVVLTFTQLMLGFILNQALVGLMLDQDVDIERRWLIWQYVGTCSRVMLSMFELSLANWIVFARILMEEVSEWFSLLAIVHKLSIGTAVIGVINGVFMQETFKVASTDDTIMMRQVQKEQRVHIQKMGALFEYADKSGDGVVDEEEFDTIMQEPVVLNYLAAQSLHFQDTHQLFAILDEFGGGRGALSAADFVAGLASLKGPARSCELREILFQQRQSAKTQEALQAAIETLSGKVKLLAPEVG